MHFRIEGSIITRLARESLYQNDDLKRAVDVLMAGLHTDMLSPEERFLLALKILDGKFKITGTYPDGDYDVAAAGPEEQEGVPGLMAWLGKVQEKLQDAEELAQKNAALEEKLGFLSENLSKSNIDRLNDLWYDSGMDGRLLNKRSSVEISPAMQDALEHYRSGRDDDYGWLRPDGMFYPVEFGKHQSWAWDYVSKYMPEEAPLCNDGRCGDILVQRNWILLHNPTLGPAIAIRDESDPHRRITKAQSKFLYDYYAERNMMQEAKKYVEDYL